MKQARGEGACGGSFLSKLSPRLPSARQFRSSSGHRTQVLRVHVILTQVFPLWVQATWKWLHQLSNAKGLNPGLLFLIKRKEILNTENILYWGIANGNPLQYSCLEYSMDIKAWQATEDGVAKSPTQLKQLSMHSQLTMLWLFR